MTMTHYPDGAPALIVAPHPKYNPLREMGHGSHWYQRWLEAWWIVTGKWSLTRAWNERDALNENLRKALTFVKAERDHWHDLVPQADRVQYPFDYEGH